MNEGQHGFKMFVLAKRAFSERLRYGNYRIKQIALPYYAAMNLPNRIQRGLHYVMQSCRPMVYFCGYLSPVLSTINGHLTLYTNNKRRPTVNSIYRKP